jgi:hypothetical protein
MSKMKFVLDLMESGTYQAFELQAMLASQKGEKIFQFGNATYDVEFAANVMAYIYHKIAERNHEEYNLFRGFSPESDSK